MTQLRSKEQKVNDLLYVQLSLWLINIMVNPYRSGIPKPPKCGNASKDMFYSKKQRIVTLAAASDSPECSLVSSLGGIPRRYFSHCKPCFYLRCQHFPIL